MLGDLIENTYLKAINLFLGDILYLELYQVLILDSVANFDYAKFCCSLYKIIGLDQSYSRAYIQSTNDDS